MQNSNQDTDTDNSTQKDKTHFGYESVDWSDKQSKVNDVFHSVAHRYDIMNDLMSGGVHRIWKHKAIAKAALRPGHQVLDLAGGTGDMTLRIAKKIGPNGSVILSDINASMLACGRERLDNLSEANLVKYSLVNAEKIPFAKNKFNAVTMAFGLRNCTDKQAVLNEMYRVLKPAGRAIILEFSHPVVPGLKTLYDAYSFSALPALGKIICNDSESYKYLAESIRMHPDQETLKGMMDKAGFLRTSYENLTGGIVAIHMGIKL
jgi:demethylmenaquinone methyltransferase / 2-methoxy-6-polyprenyl-1,4-benzoquinol methylase